MKITKETDMAEPLIEYLEAGGWEVFQEVQIYSGENAKCADIVARNRHEVLWVIEMKRTLSLRLMEQAYDWLGCANRVSVLVPTTCRYGGFPRMILKKFGIGILTLNNSKNHPIMESLMPRLNYVPLVWGLLNDALSRHQNDQQAGRKKR